MDVTLTSMFKVGDLVAYESEDKYSSTGTSRGVGPVLSVEYGPRGAYVGFIYRVQGTNGTWGPFYEHEIEAARTGEVAGVYER